MTSALETISHGDGRVDPENLSSFVAAYQTVSILKLGELWAIPIMLAPGPDRESSAGCRPDRR